MDVIKKVEGLLIQDVSKKGNSYYAFEVQITPSYKARFFPSNAEAELLKMNLQPNASVVNTNSGETDVFADFK